MSDVKFDSEKLVKDAETYIEGFKLRMKGVVDETLCNAYVNLLPYIETDAWTNYREALRIELEHEYQFSTFKKDWATNFRRAVFVENREEISKLIEQDILKRIKQLEDCRQEYDQFRYSPGGDRYIDLQKQRNELRQTCDELKAQLESAREVIKFYGNNVNWDVCWRKDIQQYVSANSEGTSEIERDQGEKAWAWLEKNGGKG